MSDGHINWASGVGLSFLTARTLVEKWERTMMEEDLLDMPRDAFEKIVGKISQADSPVGIDARYTHAIIIAYLQRISERLDKLETGAQS